MEIYAYFPGSFDPMHAGHLEVIQHILDAKIASKVFIYAIPCDPARKPHMKSQMLREAIIESSLGEMQNVELLRGDVHDVRRQLASLNDVSWVGVVGSDNKIFSKPALRTRYMVYKEFEGETQADILASTAITADRFIVFTRDAFPLVIEPCENDRPIQVLPPLSFSGLSSTQIREAIQGVKCRSSCFQLLSAYQKF